MHHMPIAHPDTDFPASTTPAEVTTLVEEHLDLVNHVVFQVAVRLPNHVDRDELARAGALGLVEAARRFDPSRGVPFGSFATRRIRGAIIDALRASDWAPRSVREVARRLDRVEQRLAGQLGRVPTLAETAAALHVSTVELDQLRDQVFRSLVLTLDAPSSGDEDGSAPVEALADRSTPEPSDALERRELHAFLRDAVSLLPERHRVVVVGYFLEERTSEDLARLLGVTASRISRMRSEAMVMLRDGIEAQYAEGDPMPTRPEGCVARRRSEYARAIASASECMDRISSTRTTDGPESLRLDLQVA